MTERLLGNRARYNAMAGAYEALVRLGSFGQFDRFYREVARELDESPGGTIVDLGCGPGALTPYLLKKVGPEGRVIGVDIAERMVERARTSAARSGWHNAEFERSDALSYSPRSPVRAVVCCLSLSTMSDPQRCLEQIVSMLEPGGRLVILDSIPEPTRRLARLVMHLKAPLVGARPSGLPLEFVFSTLEGARIRRFFFGVYSLLSARKPGRRT